MRQIADFAICVHHCDFEGRSPEELHVVVRKAAEKNRDN